MDSAEFKSGLIDLHKRLGELEEAARKLQNQNFADIVASGRARVLQLTEHADLERVHAEMYPAVESNKQQAAELFKQDGATGGGEPLPQGNTA